MKHLIAFVAIQACIKQVNTIVWKLDYVKCKTATFRKRGCKLRSKLML